MKVTFERLKPDKKQMFVEVALEEFACHSFQEASLNRLVKKLGIAKGSIYQYFDDKQSLYFYLRDYATARKREFMQAAMEATPEDFWHWLESLFLQGLSFDAQQPTVSRFLYRYSQEYSIPEVAQDMARYDREAIQFFTSVIIQQQEAGVLKRELEANMLARLIVQISKTLLGTLLADGDEKYDPVGSVIQTSEAKRNQAVRQLISVLQSGINT